ncbi:MAG: UDP-glucose--hexose-1-phosphate uridylyltransferase [Clostridium sp.]
MERIYFSIDNLIYYGVKNNLIDNLDRVFIRNKLLEILSLDEYKESELKEFSEDIEEILEGFLQYGIDKGIIEDTILERDLFDTKIMGVLIGRPSEIIKEFNRRYEKNPKKATEFYYDLSRKSNYIRVNRVSKDLKWKTNTEFGELDITINMSKPEKDPKDIAKMAKIKKSSYPKCLLCRECEGYLGNLNYPARGNHRLIPVELNKENWFFQYSPYVYFNEHSIILKEEHIPMVIKRETFVELLDFVDKFNHYFIGSNADIPIVGGSILSHNHYQGGRYKFSIEDAKVLENYNVRGYEDITVERINWPLSVIRVRGNDKEKLVDFAEIVLEKWIGYSDESLDILSYTDERHNTITPIGRVRDGLFELDLVLRNNRTTEEYPFGIFHPHEELHHIKKENIGLIEVMGLAVLPARLNNEMEWMIEYLLGKEVRGNISSHKVWLEQIKVKHNFNEENIREILEYEIGLVFKTVLEHCGVFKGDKKGIEGYRKFIGKL